MKKNKGFTLIELLAVIVILAIIALIAVPVVMNIINKANKSAFKDSAYGLLKAGETYFTSELLEDAQGITEDKVFTFPDDIDGLEFKGSKPSRGTMTVRKDGKVSMAITNGKYCVTKGFEDEDVTISDDISNCKLPGYNVEDVVYYNPNEPKVCTETEYNNNADKNGKSGCMRWYVYATAGENVKLILDHNTTGKVAWNDTGSNTDIPVTLEAKLQEDTSNWKVDADIIDVQDILNLLPWYHKLEDKTNWSEKRSADMEPIITPLMFDSDLTAYSVLEINKLFTNTLAEHESGIGVPKYLYDDLYDNCNDNGECPTYGYWTKSGLNNNRAWAICVIGTANTVSYATLDSLPNVFNNIGIRPVITLSK